MARTKGQERKYNAYLKSVNGDKKAADQMYKIWLDAQPTKPTVQADPVAQKLKDIMDAFEKDKSLKLGNKGYTIKRAKGKGGRGFVATKNT